MGKNRRTPVKTMYHWRLSVISFSILPKHGTFSTAYTPNIADAFWISPTELDSKPPQAVQFQMAWWDTLQSQTIYLQTLQTYLKLYRDPLRTTHPPIVDNLEKFLKGARTVRQCGRSSSSEPSYSSLWTLESWRTMGILHCLTVPATGGKYWIALRAVLYHVSTIDTRIQSWSSPEWKVLTTCTTGF